MNTTIKLPDFLSGLKVVGTLNESLKACRAPQNLDITDPNIVITDHAGPAAAMPPALVEAYQKNDQDFINKMQDQNYDNLEMIRKNVANVGEDAWVEVVDDDGVHFFIAYNDYACTWVYPDHAESKEKDQLVVSMGSFDSLTSQSSFASMLINNPAVSLIEGLLVGVVVKVATRLFATGLSMAFDALAVTFAECAAEAGLAAFTFVIPEAVVTAVAAVLAVGLAIGLVLLINWLISLLTPDYFIRLMIFNFDDNRDWKTVDHHMGNAKIAGEGISYEDFTLPRRKKAELPPFISGASDDIIVSYAEIDFENDSKFMEGLGVAVSMKAGDDGFTAACDCPYIGATVIKGTSPEASDLNKYFKEDNWCDGLTTNIDVNGMPVGMTLNTHHHADKNIYTATVLIGRSVE